MRIYISGGISGVPDYMERFGAVEEMLVKDGWSVANPAKVNANLPKDYTYEEILKLDFVMLGQCDAIYMMEGWEKSCGANREYGYAVAKDMIIMCEDEGGEERKPNEIFKIPVPIGGTVYEKGSPAHPYSVIGYRIGRMMGEDDDYDEDYEEDRCSEGWHIQYAGAGIEVSMPISEIGVSVFTTQEGAST